MKTKITTPIVALAARTLLFCAGLLICTVSLSQNSGPGKGSKLEFKDPILIAGTAGANGAIYKFGKVTDKVDARVTIKQRSSSLVYLKNIDLKSSGFDKAWQPQVGYNSNRTTGAAEWWMEFEISFVQEKTTTPTTVNGFDLTAIDIDGNGSRIREYVSFYNLKSYTVESNSILNISNLLGQLVGGLTGVVGKRFDGPTKNMANIDTSGTAVMVTTNYENVQTFTVRLGGVASGADTETDRMYSMYYQSFKYTDPSNSTLPVKLTSFDTKLHSNKVDIDWATSEEVNFSHFIVERSTNGTDFKEIAMIFAEAKRGGSVYEYADNVSSNASGLLHYRLKMVDQDGSFKYSNVRIVKLNASNNLVTVTAYPNPATSELRITIPANWQNRQVSYEMISLNGVVVKKQVNAHASQTETLQLGNLQSGNYLIRLKAGDETAVQMIAKK